MSRDQAALFLLIVTLIGAALRLHGLAARSIWYDEGFTLALAKRIDWSFGFFSIKFTTDAPLLAILVHGWEGVLAWIPGLAPGGIVYDVLIRLIPCAFAVLAIPLTYLLCTSMMKDPRAGLVAAFLCAVSPFQVFYAQELKSYSLYLALSLASMYCALNALETDRARYWAGYVVFLTLCVYSHFFSAWNVLLINVYFVVTLRRHWRSFWKWAGAQVVLTVLCLPAAWLAYQLNGMFSMIRNIYTIPPTFKSGFVTFKTFFAGYSATPPAYWGLFLLGSALFLWGLWRLRKRPHIFAFAILFTVVPIAGNVVMWRMRDFPMYEHRLFIFSGAVCYGVVAYGLVTLRWGSMRAIAMALMLALTAPCLADYYAHRLHPLTEHRMGVRYKVQNRDAAAYVAAHLQAGDVIGHASHFTLTPFWYYLQGRSVDQWMLRLTEGELTGMLDAYPNETFFNNYKMLPVRIESVVGVAKRVWLVESWWEPFDAPPHVRLFRGWLDGHLIRTRRVAFDGVTVYLYENQPELLMQASAQRLIDQRDYDLLWYPSAADSGLKQDLRDGLLERDPDPPRDLDLRFDLVRISDTGASPERHDTSAPPPFPKIDAQWREGQTIPVGVMDYSLLAFDGQRGRGLFASFPIETDREFRYAFALGNWTGAAHTLEGRVYECARLIEPLELSKSDWRSDAWSLWYQFMGAPVAAQTNAPEMIANLTPQTPDGETVYKVVVLDHGEYAVWVWTCILTDPVNRFRASAQFTKQPAIGANAAPTPIGIVNGNIPSGSAGWQWHRVGTVQTDGQPFRLSISAHNPDHLPAARFDVGSIAFTTPDAPGVETQSFDATVPPEAERVFCRSSALGKEPSKTIKIEIFDPEAREFRSIGFRTTAPGRI